MAKSIIKKVEAEIEVAEAKAERKSKIIEKIKYILVALLLIAEVATLGVQVYNRYVPNAQYKNAVALFGEGKKKEALLKFEKLGDLKNSEYYCNLIYADNPIYRFDHAVVGDRINFGKYNFEDIMWTVISVDEKKVMLLSSYIIDAGYYPSDIWLTDFAKKAFTETENKLIDAVAVLDGDEFTNLVQGKRYAKTEPTAKALENAKYHEDEEDGYLWWVNNQPLYDKSEYQRVIQSGANYSGYGEATETQGIRPCITIKLK